MIPLAEQTQFLVAQGGLHLTQVRMVDEAEIDGVLGRPISVIFDCGGHGNPKALTNSLRQLRRQLQQANRKRHIDVLVLSHLHCDHINGFKNLVTEMPVSIDRLILLCHKISWRVLRWQQGHRGSVSAMARASETRTEVIEFAT